MIAELNKLIATLEELKGHPVVQLTFGPSPHHGRSVFVERVRIIRACQAWKRCHNKPFPSVVWWGPSKHRSEMAELVFVNGRSTLRCWSVPWPGRRVETVAIDFIPGVQDLARGAA